MNVAWQDMAAGAFLTTLIIAMVVGVGLTVYHENPSWLSLSAVAFVIFMAENS